MRTPPATRPPGRSSGTIPDSARQSSWCHMEARISPVALASSRAIIFLQSAMKTVASPMSGAGFSGRESSTSVLS